jgi:hypothetical protein
MDILHDETQQKILIRDFIYEGDEINVKLEAD